MSAKSTAPHVIRKKKVRLGKRLDASEYCGLEVLDIVDRARSRTHDRLDGGKRVLDAVMQFADQQSLLLLGALAVGDVHEHVDRADQFARIVMNWCRVWNERHTRAIRPFGDRLHAAHNAVFFQRDGHGAFVVRQWRSVRPVEFPRSAPFAGAERRPMAPQSGGCVVVVGDAAGGIGRVDGGGQGIEQPAEAAFALTQRRLRSQAVGNLNDVIFGGCLAHRDDRPFEFAL